MLTTPFEKDRPMANTVQDSQGATDFERIGDAILFLESEFRDQPSLDDLAVHLGLSPHHLHRIFKRWAGVSPKAFVQLVTHTHARDLLEGHASVLDAALDVGLSGPSRLHDLFVKVEAMSPGEVKSKGEGLTLSWGLHETPFGEGLYVMSPRGLAGLAFAQANASSRQDALLDMKSRWPKARFLEDAAASADLAARLYTRDPGEITVSLAGTPFQLQVWKALLQIPEGRAVTYSDIAAHVGRPKAVRAVGTAVGRNPISYLIPCHRVLRLSGALGGYHWGVDRKRAMIAWESAKAGLA
jgi:AraC family transcriptional regulator, regulatory protein of adaptative response / methylated-DNA-[protein]-cysteine methyltransferase